MRLPKLVRRLWMPVIAILILALIATIELREPFQNTTTGRPAAARPAAPRNPCGPNRCDVYGACPAGFPTTTTGTDRCNSVCHDNSSNKGNCPVGSTRMNPNSTTDKRCKKDRNLKAGCSRPSA